MKLDANDFKLRLVTEKDKNLLLEWANDREVRNNSFNQEKISLEQHEKWFSIVMNDPNRILYILEYNGNPVGQCRLDINIDIAEINYSVDKRYRGQGVGEVLLRLITKDCIENNKTIKKIIGKVKVDNKVSANCFEKNGYKGSYCVYEFNV